jgi:hypothetical protein
VAQDRFDFCFGHRACFGRRDLALLIQNGVTPWRPERINASWIESQEQARKHVARERKRVWPVFGRR